MTCRRSAPRISSPTLFGPTLAACLMTPTTSLRASVLLTPLTWPSRVCSIANTLSWELFFNDWKFAGVTTYGSGRPINATITGDANRDGNDMNDRLPGASRNSYEGPDYFTTDLRLSRQFPLSDRMKMELRAESFNFMNRDNKRVAIADNGFVNAAGQFVPTARR
jgi:hypothetical protein